MFVADVGSDKSSMFVADWRNDGSILCVCVSV